MADQPDRQQDSQTAQISGTVQIKQNGGTGSQRRDDDYKQDDTKDPEKKSGRKFVIIAVVILLVIGAGIFYWRSTFTEDTDDAQVDGDLYQVSQGSQTRAFNHDFRKQPTSALHPESGTVS